MDAKQQDQAKNEPVDVAQEDGEFMDTGVLHERKGKHAARPDEPKSE